MIDVDRIAVVLLAPPFGGEGTQAVRLCQCHGFFHLNCGKALDEYAQAREETTPKIWSEIRRGNLVDDETVIDAVQFCLPIILPEKIVFDGLPRTEVQAEWLDRFFRTNFIRALIILISVSEKALLERLRVGRGGNREDDNEHTLRHRIQIFNENNLAISRYFSHRGYPLTNVDGNLPIDSVSKKIESEISRLFQKNGDRPRSNLTFAEI